MAEPTKNPSADLLKKAVGLTNQGQKGAVCPNCHQPIKDGEMVHYQAGGMEAHAQCPVGNAQQPGQQPGWQSRLNLPPGFKPKQQPTHTPGMINPNVGKPTASLVIGHQRTERKMAGRPPRFSFAVPMSAAGHVAFQLAKAGMKDFEVTHYKEDEVSSFAFNNEPEMHVAEEIVKAEFADQITSQKGMWKSWAPQENDVMELPETEERKPTQYVSSWDKAAWQARQEGKVAGQWGDRSYDSDQVHDVLDQFRPKGEDSQGFDEPVPEQNVRALLKQLDSGDPVPGHDDATIYLGVIVWLVEHGGNVPPVYRERAKQIATAYASDADYLQSWKNPMARHAELEREIEVLGGSKRASDKYRRAKTIALASEMGFEADKLASEYDAATGWRKDALYDEINVMAAQDRKFASGNRRKLAAFEKRALDATLATFVGTFVASMLVKWLGDEYAKRWGSLAQQATAKAESALQEKGVYDLGTLDKYAQESGKNRSSALLSLVGRSLALAVVMTTGIAAQKLFSGEGKQEAQAPAAVTQEAPIQNPDIYMQTEKPAPKPHRPSKEQLKQQQKQHDEQVMDQIRQQDKDRNPQNIV